MDVTRDKSKRAEGLPVHDTFTQNKTLHYLSVKSERGGMYFSVTSIFKCSKDFQSVKGFIIVYIVFSVVNVLSCD